MTLRDLANDLLDMPLWIALVLWPVAVWTWAFFGELGRLAYRDLRRKPAPGRTP